MATILGRFAHSFGLTGRGGPAPVPPESPGAGAGGSRRTAAVPPRDVAPPLASRAPRAADPAAASLGTGEAGRALASRQPAGAVAPGGGVSSLDHFRGAVGACFHPDPDPYRNLRTELDEVAGKVAALKLDNLSDAAARAVKRSLFLELAPARLAGNRQALEAQRQVQDLVQQQQRLRAELAAVRATPHAPDTIRARTQRGDALTELEELPGRIRAAEREGLRHLAAQAIDEALG